MRSCGAGFPQRQIYSPINPTVDQANQISGVILVAIRRIAQDSSLSVGIEH
ncbi:MAG: hypothetical protein ACR2NZ_13335 [Rubripirellula sp.]